MIPKSIKDHLYSMRGWKTGRKIVVIESDDWGSIRMQDNASYAELAKGGKVDKNHYNRLDSLETNTDLEALYNCLDSVKDKNGSPAKMTANFVMGNPDFEKIEASGFSEYFFENFISSYKRYYNSDDTFSLVQKGIDAKMFFPQFHGREHLQAEYWMRALKDGNAEAREGFKHSFFAYGKNDLDGHGYLSSFNATSVAELDNVKETIKEGLDLFRQIFGFSSRSVIAPQNTMHYDLLPFLKEQGVDIIQGSRMNKQNAIHPEDRTREQRFMGSINKYGQLNIVRNVTFEPGSAKIDWVAKCIKEIEIAFLWKKPAVICSHRVNYMGYLNEDNRTSSLRDLQKLLNAAQKKWPDIEFMTTVELADEILKTKSS